MHSGHTGDWGRLEESYAALQSRVGYSTTGHVVLESRPERSDAGILLLAWCPLVFFVAFVTSWDRANRGEAQGVN